MGLTRKLLKELLADREDRDELIDVIIEAHIETVAPLKAQKERLEAEAEEAASLRERLSHMEDPVWKERYEEVSAEYSAYVAEEERKNAHEEKTKAFRELLFLEGIKPDMIKLIARASGDLISSLEVQDGKVRDHAQAAAAIRREYGRFIK